MTALLLVILYPVAIQYKKGGLWSLVLPVTIFTLVVDVLANFTDLALLTLDWPKPGEWTFSQRLKRLKLRDDWRGSIARAVRKFTNYFDPGHV